MKPKKRDKRTIYKSIVALAAITAVLAAFIVCVALYWYPPYNQDSPLGTSEPFLAVNTNGQNADKLDINTATKAELTLLPGIGEVKAEAIIAYREANGPFASAEDLLQVHGIGPKTLDDLRELVMVSDEEIKR